MSGSDPCFGGRELKMSAMEPGILLVAVAVCATWAVVSLVLLTIALRRRGIKTPFPFVGALFFRNMKLYKKLSREERGGVGGLFYSYLISINAAFLLCVVSLLVWILEGL